MPGKPYIDLTINRQGLPTSQNNILYKKIMLGCIKLEIGCIWLFYIPLKKLHFFSCLMQNLFSGYWISKRLIVCTPLPENPSWNVELFSQDHVSMNYLESVAAWVGHGGIWPPQLEGLPPACPPSQEKKIGPLDQLWLILFVLFWKHFFHTKSK